ncbi:hypothetical protein R5R35_000325 [Gryllus longicercus]|uniref:Dynein heavy chain tail domain-containing protein n=1 Tax=Gryllus longicercus TaxID=2509291 RepID=A0AAN9ZHA6_9ORTH
MQLTEGDYDPLDHRRPDFEADYQRFKKGIAQAETDLRQFMLDSVDAAPNIYEKLRLMARFEKLPLECLCLDHKYSQLLDTYQTELEELRDRYNDERKEPPLARLMTPIAGRVMWVRYFYRLIEQPMDVFKKKAVIHADKARRTIKLYNVLAQVFVHCEMVYHSAWTKCVKQLRTALAQPLLIQNIQRRSVTRKK